MYVWSQLDASGVDRADCIMQITCLYDMDIPRPDNFNETYLYEGKSTLLTWFMYSCLYFLAQS